MPRQTTLPLTSPVVVASRQRPHLREVGQPPPGSSGPALCRRAAAPAAAPTLDLELSQALLRGELRLEHVCPGGPEAPPAAVTPEPAIWLHRDSGGESAGRMRPWSVVPQSSLSRRR